MSPIEATSAAESVRTGRLEMSRFQTLSAGKTVHGIGFAVGLGVDVGRTVGSAVGAAVGDRLGRLEGNQLGVLVAIGPVAGAVVGAKVKGGVVFAPVAGPTVEPAVAAAVGPVDRGEDVPDDGLDDLAAASAFTGVPPGAPAAAAARPALIGPEPPGLAAVHAAIAIATTARTSTERRTRSFVARKLALPAWLVGAIVADRSGVVDGAVVPPSGRTLGRRGSLGRRALGDSRCQALGDSATATLTKSQCGGPSLQ